MITPLHPLERGYLYACGVLRFRPAPPEPRQRYAGGRVKGGAYTPRPGSVYGKVKTAASAFIDAGHTSKALHEYAKMHGFGYDSFKGAVWKQRREREHARRRERRVAA